MKHLHRQSLRVLTGMASVVLFSMESPIWWLAVLPWAVLCILGILMTLPLVMLIGIGAGAAQADWMSDGFIIGLNFVCPTVFALIIAETIKRYWTRRTGAAK